jgi:hypothetical protein
MEDKASLRLGPPRYDPWPAIAEKTKKAPENMQKYLVTVSGGEENYSMTMCSPEMPLPSVFNLYWNRSTQYQVFVKHEGVCKLNASEIEAARRTTKKVLHAAHGARMSPEHDDFLTYFLPVVDSESSVKKNDWTRTSPSFTSLQDARLTPDSLSRIDFGVVMHQEIKYLFRRFVHQDQDPEQLADADAPMRGPEVIVSRYPKKRDL